METIVLNPPLRFSPVVESPPLSPSGSLFSSQQAPGQVAGIAPWHPRLRLSLGRPTGSRTSAEVVGHQSARTLPSMAVDSMRTIAKNMDATTRPYATGVQVDGNGAAIT